MAIEWLFSFFSRVSNTLGLQSAKMDATLQRYNDCTISLGNAPVPPDFRPISLAFMASLAYLFFRNLCRQIRRRSIYSGPEDMATVHYPLHFFTNRSDLAGEKGGCKQSIYVCMACLSGFLSRNQSHEINLTPTRSTF